jgi:hypothetical protein
MCTELSANWEYCSGVMPSDGFKVTNAAILQVRL